MPLPFTAREQRLIARLRTPRQVQAYLNALPYNHPASERDWTLRSFRGVVRHGTAHCLEAALAAAVILEQHGFPPLVLSFESIDDLDHVIFVYRQGGRWGSIARSRDPGLHGRQPVFASARSLALSYFEPYVDGSGCIRGFAVVDLAANLGRYDWRLAEHNIWRVERMLIDYPHQPLPFDPRRLQRLRARFQAFSERYPERKPVCYPGRERWSDLPAEYRRRGYAVPFPRLAR